MNSRKRYMDFGSRFDRNPAIAVSTGGERVVSGWPDIAARIAEAASSSVVAVETYQGVDIDRIRAELAALDGDIDLVDSRTRMKPEDDIRTMTFPDVTDDRVFGRMTALCLADFFALDCAGSFEAGTVLLGHPARRLVNHPEPLVSLHAGDYRPPEAWRNLRRLRIFRNLGPCPRGRFRR